MKETQSYILWLPSWYPCKLTPFDGDFIQRHAITLTEFSSVHVLHIIRDAEGVVTKDVKIEERTSANLVETIIYYYSGKYPFDLLESFFSMRKYRSVFKDYLNKLISKNGKPSVVHVHVAFKAGLIALWLKKKFGINYLLTEHWTGYGQNAKNNFYTRTEIFKIVVRRIIRNAKLIIPVSKDLGEKIKNIIPGMNYSVIPNVVNTDFFYYRPCIRPVFRFAHYTSPDLAQKNSDGLLRALADLKKTTFNWECIIYGPPDEKLVKLIQKLGLEKNVTLIGEVPYKEVAGLLQSASAFVSFSNYENQPCSILEALCCGLPVIAARVGGIPEIINNENGILINPEDEIQLTEAMLLMMTNYNSYSNKQIADKAIKKYNYHTVGKMLYTVYESL